MKKDQKACQDGMAKLLDLEYRAMQRQSNRSQQAQEAKGCNSRLATR